MFRISCAVVLTSLVALYFASQPAFSAEITSLPGLNATLNFKQYSGYITANTTYNRRLFYWFVESQRNPATDPVVVWLQGGPGCSSMIGLMLENGPFRPNYQGGLSLNPESWNRIANVLYIDAPAGVGFSYQPNTTVYHSNNNQTAHDNYVFLQGWYQEFPQFSNNPLWITGESYAGDYVPQLVNEIIDGPDLLMKKVLAGFMIGNPVLSCEAWKENSNNVQMELFYWHGMISYSQLQLWKTKGCDAANVSQSKPCDEMYLAIRAIIEPLDGDNLYQNPCTGNATLDATVRSPNCVSIQDLRNTYLNRPDVQQAIHAQPTNWEACTTDATLVYTTEWPNMLTYYNKFFQVAPQLRILIYSGDVDIATVPHAYTQLCLSYLARPQIKPWRRWTVDGLLAGFYEVYDTYTYATVKGAGHEVPQYQPYFAYNMFERFLNGSF